MYGRQATKRPSDREGSDEDSTDDDDEDVESGEDSFIINEKYESSSDFTNTVTHPKR